MSVHACVFACLLRCLAASCCSHSLQALAVPRARCSRTAARPSAQSALKATSHSMTASRPASAGEESFSSMTAQPHSHLSQRAGSVCEPDGSVHLLAVRQGLLLWPARLCVHRLRTGTGKRWKWPLPCRFHSVALLVCGHGWPSSVQAVRRRHRATAHRTERLW